MPTPYRLQAIALKDVGVFDDTLIHFNPIEDKKVDEELAEVHLFTGPNGCGKSTLLYAIARLFSINQPGYIDDRFTSENSTIEYHFNNTHIAVQNKSTIKFSSKTQWKYEHTTQLVGFTIGSNGKHDSLETISPIFYSGLTQHIPDTLFYSKKFHYSAFAYSGLRQVGSALIESIKEIGGTPLLGSLSFSHDNKFSTVSQWVANCIAKSAIESISRNENEANEYVASLAQIQDFILDVSGLRVEFKLDTKPLAINLSINGQSVPLSTLPDGLKSILSWVCDLAQRLERIPWAQPGDIFSQPIILLLDEIDIHLHPKWQRRILPATQKLLPNAQIFASTHSPFVVGSVDHAWIYELPEKGKQTEREIKGVPSNPAKSYSLILKEVFDVKEEFGEEIEKQFERFYDLRDAYLKTGEGKEELFSLAEELRPTSEEVAFIVDRELRQINRIRRAS